MIKRISLFGNPKTIGEQHGKEGKNEVIHSLETYERLFWDYAGINWKKARERALFHLQAIERYDSDLVEEMEGLASGAGVDFEDILVLNARSEIALTRSYFKIRFTHQIMNAIRQKALYICKYRSYRTTNRR